MTTYNILNQPVVSSLVVFNRDDDAFFNPARLGLTGFGYDGYFYEDGVQDMNQVASWASEGESATRGTLVHFPLNALVVVSKAVCSIFDISSGSPVTWMAFYKSDEYAFPTNFLGLNSGASYSPTQVTWGNGVLSLLLTPDAGSLVTASALLSYDFVQDEIYVDSYAYNSPYLFVLDDTTEFTFADPAITAATGTLTTAGTTQVFAIKSINGPTGTFSFRARMGVTPGSNTASMIGLANLTSTAVNVSNPPANIFEVGVTAAGFVYSNISGGSGTPVILIAASSLMVGTYEISVNYVGATELSITVYPTGDFGAVQTFLLSSVTPPTGLNSFVVSVGGVDDMLSDIGYSGGEVGTIFLQPVGFETDGQYNVIQTNDFGGMMLLTSQKYTNFGSMNPFFLVEHGYGASVASTLTTLATNSVVQSMLDNGWVVVLLTHTNPSHFGNAEAVAEMTAAVASVEGYLNVGGNPGLIGIGMGALACLNFVTHSAVNALGLVGISPITSLGSYYQTIATAGLGGNTNDATIAAAVQTAYGFTSPSSQTAATAGYDPILESPSLFGEYLPTVGAESNAYPNIVLFASPSDTIVSYTANAEAFSSAVPSTLHTTSGGHNDPSNYPGAEIEALFANWISYGVRFNN